MYIYSTSIRLWYGGCVGNTSAEDSSDLCLIIISITLDEIWLEYSSLAFSFTAILALLNAELPLVPMLNLPNICRKPNDH